jgi:hypothetical protein
MAKVGKSMPVYCRPNAAPGFIGVKPTLADVARKLGGEAWLLRGLQHFARVVGRTTKAVRTVDEERMLKAARDLEAYLPLYVELEKQFGFEAPDWIDDLSNALSEAIEHLEWDTVKRRGDGRRATCALVVGRAYQLIHGPSALYSEVIGEACELYWQACGHNQTGKEGKRENWRRILEEVKKEDNPWPLNVLEEFRSGART